MAPAASITTRDQLAALLDGLRPLASRTVTDRDTAIAAWEQATHVRSNLQQYAPFLAALRTTVMTGIVPEISEAIVQAFALFMGDDDEEETSGTSPHREAALMRWIADRDTFHHDRCRAFLTHHVFPRIPESRRDLRLLEPLHDPVLLCKAIDGVSMLLVRAMRLRHGRNVTSPLEFDQSGASFYARDQIHDLLDPFVPAEELRREIELHTKTTALPAALALAWIAMTARNVPDLFPDWTSTIIDTQRVLLARRIPHRNPSELPQT
ncbi:hypothetical protein HY632_04200 [Candidatus Uhrbacteria bacterium]|nr:hypothetical protein [Candidatus Uhrbacteria bacterium]